MGALELAAREGIRESALRWWAWHLKQGKGARRAAGTGGKAEGEGALPLVELRRAVARQLAGPGGRHCRRGERVRADSRLDLALFTVWKSTVIKLNMSEAKTHLSRYLSRVMKGRTILLCKRNVPVAEIPLPASRRRKRPIVLARGTASLPPALFEPLPRELEAAFNAEEQ